MAAEPHQPEAAEALALDPKAYLLAAALAAIRDPKASPLLPHDFAAHLALRG